MKWLSQLEEILSGHDHKISFLKPSEWAEKNRLMTSDVTSFPGKYSYKLTPYIIELVDCLSPDSDFRIGAIMKGAQLGLTTGLVESGTGYIISEQPGNTWYLSRDETLAKRGMARVDQMIDGSNLRHLIRSNVNRKKQQKTGDTALEKEFPGGGIIGGSVQTPAKMRQMSFRYGFIDDYESAPQSDKDEGSTTFLIQERFKSYYTKMKLWFISTPAVKQTSNIEPLYLKGDQRKYHVPCPQCATMITLEWRTKTEEGEPAGITWKLDENGRLVDNSVGYICQSCGDFFTEKHKYKMNLEGEWIPTAQASEPGFRSYHINSLYAPPGMFDWEYYVRKWIDIHPVGGSIKIDDKKVFHNLVLGETWEVRGEAPKANKLAMNIRPYQIGLVPDQLSEADGNGKIVLLTCGTDLNGVEDDARLDFEIVAWSESGASYSVKHGSIGTFIPRRSEKQKEEPREKWTYKHNEINSVWVEFEKIITADYQTESGRRMKIFISGVDTGHYTQQAYHFIDHAPGIVVGLKGKDDNKIRSFWADTPVYSKARERANLYLVEVNQVKDELAEKMKLKWESSSEIGQPVGFMNFPQPENDLYNMKSFFSHFESEHRIIETNKTGTGVGSRWVKRNDAVQNHLWDCRIYNHAIQAIFVDKICRESGIKQPTWTSFVNLMKSSM